MSVITAGSTRYTLDEAVGIVLDNDDIEVLDSGEEEIQILSFPLHLSLAVQNQKGPALKKRQYDDWLLLLGCTPC